MERGCQGVRLVERGCQGVRKRLKFWNRWVITIVQNKVKTGSFEVASTMEIQGPAVWEMFRLYVVL